MTAGPHRGAGPFRRRISDEPLDGFRPAADGGSESPRPLLPLTRRAALGAAVATLMSACTREADSPERLNPERAATTQTPTPLPATDVPRVAPYELLAGEIEPRCKAAAVRAVEAALTWSSEAGGSAGAGARLRRIGQPSALARRFLPLLDGAVASSVTISYPQYGGLSDDRSKASVMIPAEQRLRDRPGAEPTTRSMTLDVRLSKVAGVWRADDVLVARKPPAPTAASAVSRAVLETDRIVLPAAARADVQAGAVDERVLDLLAALSRRWALRVQVFKSGHPYTVFGTDRVSNHSLGRAVDIWSIDGVPVIDRRRSPWRALMAAAADLGADEIGGPEDLDRKPGRRPYFTNAVHQDHVHLGFEV
jgi:hypothetical protein